MVSYWGQVSAPFCLCVKVGCATVFFSPLLVRSAVPLPVSLTNLQNEHERF